MCGFFLGKSHNMTYVKLCIFILWKCLRFKCHKLAKFLSKHTLLGTLILVGQARKLVFNNPTSLFVYDNLSMKKLGLLCVNSHKLKVWD